MVFLLKSLGKVQEANKILDLITREHLVGAISKEGEATGSYLRNSSRATNRDSPQSRQPLSAGLGVKGLWSGCLVPELSILGGQEQNENRGSLFKNN